MARCTTLSLNRGPARRSRPTWKCGRSTPACSITAIAVWLAIEMSEESRADAKLDSEAYKALEAAGTRVYNAPTLPMMSTGATDMAQLRVKGVQCFGIGPAVDFEDAPKGFGAHSDQERLLESELHRFVRFNWDVVTNLARTK